MMKKLLLTIVFGILGVGVYGQTIKGLGYNTTNGEVVAATNVVWTNSFSFSTNTVAAEVRTNLGLGATAQTIFAVKTNDQTIINETNATTITDLTFATEEGARYVVTFLPIIEASLTTTALTVVASNATAFGSWNSVGAGFASTNDITNENGFVVTTARAILQTFYVEGGTNSGTISVTFRSTVATNTNTIKAGSFLRADKMP
jgi:hypothetical protein